VRPAYLHRILLQLFLSGAVMTGFGHDAEMIGLGIIVLALLIYIVRPKHWKNVTQVRAQQTTWCPVCGAGSVSGTCPECGGKVG
jgi:hypothetical protein